MKRIFTLLTVAVAFALSTWAETAVFDFHTNALTMFEGITAASTSSTHDGDFTVSKSTTVNGVVLTVNPSDANTPNRIWNDYNLGLQLRVYGGTFSFAAPEGETINAIQFDTSNWNDPEADSGTVTENYWGGSANTVTFTVGGQIRINSITVAYGESTIEPTAQSAPLWKVWYMGEDGLRYTIEDDLYVDFIDNDGLIYVTDNATTILFDLYADYGYVWEDEWMPDWIAIDCGDNTELAQAIQGMTVIKGSTLTGTLQDNYTNPRFVVTTAPEAGEGSKPEIVYRLVELTDSLNANGREILYVHGTYNNGKIEGTIEAENGTTLQSIEFYDETGNNVIPNGADVYAKAYILQKEVWKSDQEAYAPARASRPAKMMVDDPAWFTNYEIHAFELDYEVTGVEDVNTTKAVQSVQYVNAMGKMSDAPFSGVNIIITRYTDGTQSARKALH